MIWSSCSWSVRLCEFLFVVQQYLKCFMKALEYEYSSKGITFQCLLPFYVATRMTQYSSTLSNPSLFIPTATTYVRHALSTLGCSSETPGYWPHSVQVNHLIATLLLFWYHLNLPVSLWVQKLFGLNSLREFYGLHKLGALGAD